MNHYEQNRNRLIPFAEEEADRRMKRMKKRNEVRPCRNEEYLHDFWSEFFHDAMERLVRAHGLVGGGNA